MGRYDFFQSSRILDKEAHYIYFLFFILVMHLLGKMIERVISEGLIEGF